MNLEPMQEAPRRREAPKEIPMPASIQKQALEDMREFHEFLNKGQAEIVSSGGSTSAELEHQRQQAEAAYAELQDALKAVEGPEANIEKTKDELRELLGESRVDELYESPEEVIDGSHEQLFTNQLQQLRTRYGEDIYKKIINNYTTPAKELKDFIEAITDGGVELDPDDLEDSKFFSFGEPTELFINTYRLMKPGLTKDKIAAIEKLVQQGGTGQPEQTSTLASRKYIRVPEGYGLDKDDKDYVLDDYLEATVTPESQKIIDEIAGALAGGRAESGPVNQEFIDSFKALFAEGGETMAKLNDIPSAQGFAMYHERFKRSRNIPAFKTSLEKKTASLAAAFYENALEEIGDPARAAVIALAKTRKLVEEAVRIFLDVHSPRLNMDGEQYAPSPIEAMRGFNEWISSEASNSFAKGEFHVGRDTLMTTYTARHAKEWGKVSGKERAKKIRHVDISRTIVNNTPRAILANYLKQNGINEDLMGVDTGYRGTGPQDALLAVMTPEKKKALIAASPDKQVIQGMSPQIKLMEENTQATNRSIEYENKFDGIVDWMEVLPKYTERSQYVAKSFTEGSDRLLVVSSERNPSEQLLAWVVQNAVWREFAPKQKEKQP